MYLQMFYFIPTVIFLFQGHTKSVEVVVFSPDCKQLATGSWDRTAILWDVEVNSYIAFKFLFI